MVDSRKLGHDIDGAIATGRDNAAIRADVEGWCDHLAIETLGISMVGQMAGVPIGPHRLSCQYAKYSTESSFLRSLFQRFIIDNCAACPHHQPGPRAQFGRDYLTAAQDNDARAREAESKRHHEIERLRQELIELANQRGATAQVDAASVFRLTADLFAEIDDRATQMLCETSEVAPELFDDKVVALLELGVSDEIFAVKCLPVLACLARKAPEIRDRVRPRVIAACRLDLPVEMTADAIDACLSNNREEVTDDVIERLIVAQNYQRPFGGWDEEEPVFTRTLALLVKLIDWSARRVAAVIGRHLQIDAKWPRANACRVTQELSKLRPAFGLAVLPALLRSLELDDDAYEGVSADSSAVRAVSELLVLRWEASDEILRREISSLSVDAQTVLVGAYEAIFRSADWRDETTDGLDDCVVAGAINRCLEMLLDSNQEPSVRRAATGVIHSACRAGAQAALDTFDRLFGCLAIALESSPPAPTPMILLPGQEHRQQQEEMLRQQDRGFEWTRFQQELQNVIEEIGKRQPVEVGKALITAMDAANSAGQQSLRLNALELLGKVASRESELCIVALPSLMACLMDYSSPKAPVVRAVAIRAVADAFQHHALAVPLNVVDVIVLHLRDEYVVVHKAAVNAFRFWHAELTELQRREATFALFNIWTAYARNANEIFFMDDIARAMMSVCYSNGKLSHVALSLICDYLPTTQVLVDSQLCEQLTASTAVDSQVSAKVGKALVRCLSRHNRDPYPQGRDWRVEAADWLSSLPRVVWQQVLKDFSTCAQQVSQRDPGEVLLFASVLCEHGEHAAEAQCLLRAAEAARGHSFFHGLHDRLQQLHQCALASATGVAT